MRKVVERFILLHTFSNTLPNIPLVKVFFELNIGSYIANRLLKNDKEGRISKPIVRIATIGIVVGVALMLLSVAVVKGFQNEIRDKVVGFGSHFQITSNDRNFSKDSQRILFDPEVYNALKSAEGVRHVQKFATKPGILETGEALQGVVIKGVDKDFDWKFLSEAMIEGTVLNSTNDSTGYDIIISSYLAKRLKLALNEKVSLYLFNEYADPRQRNFKVVGIYNTGLEDFDQQFVFVDLRNVQRLAGWGLRVEAQADSVCIAGGIAMAAYVFGGSGDYKFDWSISEWTDEGPNLLYTDRDTTVMVVATDAAGTAPDTAWISVDYLDDSSSLPCRPFTTKVRTTGGSDSKYIGGYEILIADYDQLLAADDQIFGLLTTKFLQTQKITDRNPEIFSWLEMLDINVIIIMVLMIVISIVNMTSALLIIILERQNMIGTLKALGMKDSPVMQIFLRQAVAIIGRGIFWGNVVGIGIAFLQWQFAFIPLDQENYYLDRVPIHFDFATFLLLDAAVIIICALAMLLPALYVTRITPIKAIRFS